MLQKTSWVGIGVFIAILIVGIYFLGKGGGKSHQTTPTPASQTSSSTAKVTEAASDEEVQEITLEAMEFFYSPESITVKKGQKVRLTLVNKGRVSHDFVVEKMNITTEIASPGETVTTEFTIQDAGAYSFYCSIGNHRAMGMEGPLIVE